MKRRTAERRATVECRPVAERRTVLVGLASVTASGLAGCVGLGGRGGSRYRISLDRVPDDDLASAVALTPDEQSSVQRAVIENATAGEYQTRVHTSLEDGDYVAHEGSYFRIRISDGTYAAEKVADSAEAFRQSVADEFVAATFDREALSEEERRILRQATDDSYAEMAPISDGYRALLERIVGGELPEGPGRRFVRYDGKLYEVAFTEVVP